ncbi:MAG: hypothetical protein R6W68_13745 [Ignavibacteriaceae bacterium]
MFTSYSQGINKLNCDSLFAEFEVIEPKYHVVWKMTEFIGNMDSVRKSFYDEVKNILPDQKEYKLLIGAMIDTLGNVICTKKYLGINDVIDSLALAKVMEFKFIPAEIRNEKIQIREMIVLMNRKNE